MKRGRSAARITARRCLALALFALGVALLSGCASASPPVRPKPADVAPDPVATLQSLHDKIVYVVEESVGTTQAPHQKYSLFWIDPSERKPHLILSVTDPETGELGTSYWPDRSKMLLRRAISGNTRTGSRFISDIDGSNPRELVRGNVWAFFPDGEHLLVRSDFTDGGQTYFTYRTDLDGGHPVQLTRMPEGVKRKHGPDYMYEGDGWADVPPDGKLIVYDSGWYTQGGGPHDLFRIAKDGSGLKRLTWGQKSDTDWRVYGFSHDGSRIAVGETRHYSNRDSFGGDLIDLLDLNGRILKRIPSESTVLGWSPTDDALLLHTSDGLGMLDIDTGKVTELVRAPWTETSGGITDAAWLQ